VPITGFGIGKNGWDPGILGLQTLLPSPCVCVQMASKYKAEAERWRQRLDECETVNARLREELVAVHQLVQQMYSTRAPASALSSLSGSAVPHNITPPNSLESSETAD